MNLECDEECTCDVGPFSSCPTCRKYGRDYFSDCEELPTTTVNRPWSSYSGYREPEVEPPKKVVYESAGYSPVVPNKIIKAKWLETVTDSAALFVTKQGCVWIPLGMINSMDRTKKGKYKVEVYPSFNPVYRDLANRYFKNPNKEK